MATLEEARAHSDRPGIREWVQAIDRALDEFEAQKLRKPKQFPEIDEDSFTLVWDFVADKTYENDRTVLKHGKPRGGSRTSGIQPSVVFKLDTHRHTSDRTNLRSLHFAVRQRHP